MNVTSPETQQASLADEEIVSRIIAGESRLYEIIMRRYNARLYRIGMSIVNNDTEVEDIMQVAYIKAYEHLPEFKKNAAFGTWLTRILINESLLHLKNNKRYTSVDMNNDIEAEMKRVNQHTPVNQLLNKELSQVLEAALVQLPEKYRLVFVLREMESMSTAETMNTLNITEANVKVRLNRAKTMLRDTLGSYYKNDSIYQFHLVRCDRIVKNVFAKLGIAAS